MKLFNSITSAADVVRIVVGCIVTTPNSDLIWNELLHHCIHVLFLTALQLWCIVFSPLLYCMQHLMDAENFSQIYTIYTIILSTYDP